MRPNSRPAMPLLSHFMHNLLCTGASGSGKTAFVMLPLLIQIAITRRHSCVVIDLKGDMAAMHLARETADRLCLPFAFFTIDPRLPGCLWNPFVDPAFLALSPGERSDLFVDAAGISQGLNEKNGDYFPNISRLLARGLFRHYGHEIDSAHAMRSILGRRSVRQALNLTKKDFDNASSVFAAVDALADVPQLNVTPSMLSVPDSYFQNALSVDEALTTPAIYWLHLPASLNPTVAKIVSRLFPFLAFTRAGVLANA